MFLLAFSLISVRIASRTPRVRKDYRQTSVVFFINYFNYEPEIQIFWKSTLARKKRKTLVIIIIKITKS